MPHLINNFLFEQYFHLQTTPNWLYDNDGNEIAKNYYDKSGNLIKKIIVSSIVKVKFIYVLVFIVLSNFSNSFNAVE